MQRARCSGKTETESLSWIAELAGVVLGPYNQQNQGRWKSQDKTQEQYPCGEPDKGAVTKYEFCEGDIGDNRRKTVLE